jgi:hypothetical protein
MYGISSKGNMKVIGSIIECMAKEKQLGQMEDHMKDNINMIKNTVSEFTPGLTEENTLDIGKIVNSMDLHNIKYPLVKKG